jgi:3-oxoacyl-[acyl-carrier protein] reductase
MGNCKDSLKKAILAAMPNWLDFSGKVALVTGSSRGIGAGMVRALNQLGARCIVNYVGDPQGRNLSDAQGVAASLKDPLVIECDVGSLASVTSMMDLIRQQLGGLEILINNAGIIRDRTIKKMSEADWDDVLRINLTGTYHCIQQAIPLLRNGGRIVNLSSVTGQLGLFGQANYASSKAGIIALTRVAARELARQQITVNAIAPGFIDTDMTRTMPPDVARRLLEQVPIGRMGKVEDVVDAALFLCSEHAQYITGQVLHVSGGFYMA